MGAVGDASGRGIRKTGSGLDPSPPERPLWRALSWSFLSRRSLLHVTGMRLATPRVAWPAFPSAFARHRRSPRRLFRPFVCCWLAVAFMRVCSGALPITRLVFCSWLRSLRSAGISVRDLRPQGPSFDSPGFLVYPAQRASLAGRFFSLWGLGDLIPVWGLAPSLPLPVSGEGSLASVRVGALKAASFCCYWTTGSGWGLAVVVWWLGSVGAGRGAFGLLMRFGRVWAGLGAG